MTDLVFIEEAPMQGLERPASPGVTIGRAECDVDLNDPDVSRRHAVVRRVDEGLAIEDLGSLERYVCERSPHRGDRRDRRRGPHPLRQHRLAIGAFLGRRRRRRSQYSGRRGGQRARRLTCVFGGHGESLSACWPEACCCLAPAGRRQPPTSAPRVPPRPAARPVRPTTCARAAVALASHRPPLPGVAYVVRWERRAWSIRTRSPAG